jgi:sigma-B regulation protein RsbU (phosphoserine phosphatase)
MDAELSYHRLVSGPEAKAAILAPDEGEAFEDLRITSLTRMLLVLLDNLARANQRIQSDAHEVQEVQRSLLPDPLPKIPGLEIAAGCQPCGRASGDLYDIFPLDHGTTPRRWCVFIGDASGHGVAAAMVISIVQSILRAHPPRVSSAAELLAHSNRHLCRKKIHGFVTAFIAVYEPSACRLTYASAGHPPPLVKSAFDGRVSRLDAVTSYPLGIDTRATLSEATVYLSPGDAILLYTDGITEARDAAGEMFSEERLQSAFVECDDEPAALVEKLQTRVKHHQLGCDPLDDQTLVAIMGV